MLAVLLVALTMQVAPESMITVSTAKTKITEYALMAAEVINDNAESVTRLFGAVKKHDWVLHRSFQRWEGRFDNLEVYAIRCLRNRLSVAVLKAPFEFFEPDTLFCREVLDAEEAVTLRGAFPTIKWSQFPNETPS